MATLTLSSSNWSAGQLRITYTASNGTLKITEIEGTRTDGYRSWDISDTTITVSVGGTSKSISLSHYIDFDTSWTSWGATDTSWTGLSNSSGSSTSSISITVTMPSSTTAYSGAKFTGNATMSWTTYTITYNANGGTGAPNSDTKIYGTTLKLSSTKPTRTGYTFVGWGTSSTDTTADYSAGGNYTANASDTLYAIWKKTITLSYNANNGSGAPSSQSQTIYNATTSYKFTISSTKPTRTGYTFLGWSTSSTATSSSYSSGGSITLSDSDTLYAVWSENKLTVNYYSNYATSAFSDALNTVGSDKNVKVWTYDFYYDNDYSTYGLANYSGSSGSVYMTRTGYTATGNWGTSVSGETLVNENTGFSTGQALAKALGKDISSGNASVNIYAQWEINTYTIAYNSNGGSGNMSSQTVKWSSDFILSDNTFTREGYKFIGWNACRNDDNKWYVVGQGWLTEDEILEGGYSKKVYSNQDELTFDASWIKGNESARLFTLYAIWEISGVVYVDNGTALEPYLVYIDNGTSWDLYIAYIDNGTSWDIVS